MRRLWPSLWLCLWLVPTAAAATAPVRAQKQLLAAPMRGAGDLFGQAIAADRDFAVVGAPARSVVAARAGAFYLLQRVDEVWSVIATHEEPVTAVVDRDLGFSLAIGDELLAAGAPGYSSIGVVYVYTYTMATGWVTETTVASPEPTAYSRFGTAVGVSQGQLLVGETPTALPAMTDTVIGKTYVYDAAQNWAVTQTLTPQDSQMGDRFGYAIAVDGDTAVIAAPGKESGRGAVYVFTRSAGVWTTAQKLVIAGDRVENDFFGHALAIAGDRVLVGAYGRYGQLGAAYLFVRSGGTWTQTQELTAEVPMASEVFGARVALTAEHALVGGWGYQFVDAIGGRGGGYLYRGSGDVLTLLAALRADDGVPGDLLGVGLALSEGSALLGAPQDDAPTEPVFDASKAPGSARVFGLVQAPGEPCVDDLDCEAPVRCCEAVCVATDACEAATSSSGSGGSSGAVDPPTTASGAPEGTSEPEVPGVMFEAGQAGCGCRESPGRVAGAVVMGMMLLSLRRRRVAGRGPGV